MTSPIASSTPIQTLFISRISWSSDILYLSLSICPISLVNILCPLVRPLKAPLTALEGLALAKGIIASVTDDKVAKGK